MRITLVAPAGWLRISEDRLQLSDGSLTIVHGPLRPLPDDVGGWIDSSLRSDAPTGTRISSISAADHWTNTGWPSRIVEVQFLADSGQILQCRAGAFYSFFEYGAVALARAADPEVFARTRAEWLSIFASCEPDWSSQVVAVHELWEGLDSAKK